MLAKLYLRQMNYLLKSVISKFGNAVNELLCLQLQSAVHNSTVNVGMQKGYRTP